MFSSMGKGGASGPIQALLALAGGIAVLASLPAQAQQQSEAVDLPAVEVTSTRLVPTAVAKRPGRRATTTAPKRGAAAPPVAVRDATGQGGGGPAPAMPDLSGVITGTIITGASSTVITRADIARSSGQTVQDLLGREAGIQIRSNFGGVNGAQTTVDMRGFGVTASSNTLVLVNGRRLNDVDLQGVDFSAIPKDSIERIEITRGNSGSVLYGDGAVGGVINIVTKGGFDKKVSGRIEGSVGSFQYVEGSASASASSSNVAVSAYGNVIDSDGYRRNNRYQQSNAVGDLRWTDRQGTTAYLNISGDSQHIGLPGGRLVDARNGTNLVLTDPRGAATPFDYADKQGVNVTLGVTRVLAPGTELIVDGGVRQKNQQAAFFDSFSPDFDRSLRATLTTYSLTPRITNQHEIAGMSGKLITGVDIYDATYGSDRGQRLNVAPNHRYDLSQTTVAGYFMETIAVRPTTDVSFGSRLQWNDTTARDQAFPTAPGFSPPAGDPLDTSEVQYALHLGAEHRLTENVALFARAARSFRLPTVDERVGVVGFGSPTNFDLRTQTSHDIEGGVRTRFGAVTVQTSVYHMWLENELFYSPATFTNINLDPTKRYGIENVVSWQASETLQFKGSLTYARSLFRDGVFAGNDVPMISRWSGSASVSWDIYGKYLVFDATARFFSSRRMDNDSSNTQVRIPGHAITDVRIGGQYDKMFWSFSVQNLFDVHYFDYAISAQDFGTTLPIPGVYNAYPLPGRTFLAKAGVTW
jgi:iron complex outermembrane receptor protein